MADMVVGESLAGELRGKCCQIATTLMAILLGGRKKRAAL